MSRAFETVESYYLSRQTCPELMRFNDVLVNKSLDLCRTGFAYPLAGRDREGRRIILLQSGKLDVEAFTSADGSRAMHLIGQLILEEEETQISGLSIICDLVNLKLNQIGPPNLVHDSIHLLKHSWPARIKNIYFVNVPSIATFPVQLLKSFLSQKLRERVFVLKNYSELKTHIDGAILPKHMDGMMSENEIIDDFLKLKDKHLDNVKKILHFEIDRDHARVAKLSNEERESIGSFRKLEID